MSDPTNNLFDDATPRTADLADTPTRPRWPDAAVPDAAVPDAAVPDSAWGAGPVRRRWGTRPRHAAQQWPLPVPQRGARLLWWLLVAVVAGATGALLTLGVVALNWPH